jgi:NADH-quinone oxidoreductase subunit G
VLEGLQHQAWLKAKPEWAKGSRLVRITPRYNPDVNDYWMCDIGRFQYLWVEGDQRLRRPQLLSKDGQQQAVTWKDALLKVRDLLNEAGRKDAGSVRMLASAHASHEELFLLKRLAVDMKGDEGVSHVHVAWKRTEKQQPGETKFRVPATDAPNVLGARSLGLPVGPGLEGEADLSGVRSAVEQGRVSVLYVLDPGPDGSMGDVQWLAEARKSGRLPVLIYQGVLATTVSKVADVVLPGLGWVEKDATLHQRSGPRAGVSRAINPPGGEAVDDWRIASVRRRARPTVLSASSQQVRADVSKALQADPAYAGLGELAFSRPVAAEHWLQASNPMERMKWDDMFRDLPPVRATCRWARAPGRGNSAEAGDRRIPRATE